MIRKSISIAIFGPVSAGKSTLLNGLFANQYSDMKIKRTTMVPQVYFGTDSDTSSDNIYESNKQNNIDLIDSKLTLENCAEIGHRVKNIRDLLEVPKNIDIDIYDLPGLNDGQSKEVYFEYIKRNFHKFDIVLLVIDINEAFNTEGTREILYKLKELVTYQKVIIIANKCDDMIITDSYQFDDELREMFEQIKEVVSKSEFSYPPTIIPFCSQDVFIYRTLKLNPEFKLDMKYINKIGLNEFSKSKWAKMAEPTKRQQVSKYVMEADLKEILQHSGFNLLEYEMNTIDIKEYLVKKIDYELGEILQIDQTNIDLIIGKYNDIIRYKNQLFGKDNMEHLVKIDEHYSENLSIYFKTLVINVTSKYMYSDLLEKLESIKIVILQSSKDIINTKITEIREKINNYILQDYGYLWERTVEEGEFLEIVQGQNYTIALRNDGSITGWGDNNYGQINCPKGNDFVKIACGTNHSVALKNDGSIVGWGYNNQGQINCPKGNDFVKIACVSDHNIALKKDGSIAYWGWNSNGHLHLNNIPKGNDFVKIACGLEHTIALKKNGSIVGWGVNYNGHINCPKGNDFVKIACGSHHNIALKNDGNIVGWGYNSQGQINCPKGNDFVKIACGLNYSVALKNDGSIVGWGYNDQGQMDNNIPNGNDFIKIKCQGSVTIAYKKNGSICCWGILPQELPYYCIPQNIDNENVKNTVIIRDKMTVILYKDGSIVKYQKTGLAIHQNSLLKENLTEYLTTLEKDIDILIENHIHNSVLFNFIDSITANCCRCNIKQIYNTRNPFLKYMDYLNDINYPKSEIIKHVKNYLSIYTTIVPAKEAILGQNLCNSYEHLLNYRINKMDLSKYSKEYSNFLINLTFVKTYVGNLGFCDYLKYEEYLLQDLRYFLNLINE